MKRSRHFDARQARSESSTQSFDTSDPAAHRQARLERILLTEVQSLLRDEASDPALEGVQLISLSLSPDGGHARLGYVVETTPGNEKEARQRTHPALQRATGFIRARLAAQLDWKRMPRLTFTFVGVAEPALLGDEEGGDEWPV